ncbi:ferredoxin reductase [Pseudoxanthomonas dokdonensis]|uniref:Oxidoreductase n=1 Tax=Pseudoxanthomonas dokdonensis TaxID=344882 RepID=A0A0R0CWI9_9GAMM|nr:ferredoxin reductase [Pseudoxanthomonas dokdonensis]KRG70882.1 oxidoreductase [Pseudoxanthomonas dokdonensis]
MSAVVRPRKRIRQPAFKRLLAPVVAPDVFDFWASRLNRSWSWERPLARLVSRQRASRDAMTLLFKPNRNWQQGFRAGQHVSLTAEVDGVRITRSYSLVEPPRADGCLAITVKAIEGGRLSQALCRAEPGLVVELGSVFGDMRVASKPHGDYLLLAAGSGITPLMAMTRALAAKGMPVPVTLVYWARQRDELCFVDELRTLAAQHANFTLRLMLTGEAAQAADEAEGRIDAALVSALALDREQTRVMACGPGGFVEAARALLDGQVKSFQAEAFTLPPVSNVDSGSVQVHLRRRGVRLELPRGSSLLSALEAQGIKPPSGCRMGICNTCACGKASGSVRHLPSGDLQHEPQQALKLCIHSAATDLELDL